jgi:hypothetical protein
MTWERGRGHGLPGRSYRIEIQGILNGKLCGDV